MPASFPELSGVLERPRNIASTIIGSSSNSQLLHHKRWPSILEKDPHFGKVTPPLKTILFEGAEIIFGPQFFPPPRQNMWQVLLAK